eukprot:m.128579 g.128579  ORF g.128579 m.128579 type:complete len:124 (+) comp9452_c4_seq6:5879-6250(+)
MREELYLYNKQAIIVFQKRQAIAHTVERPVCTSFNFSQQSWMSLTHCTNEVNLYNVWMTDAWFILFFFFFPLKRGKDGDSGDVRGKMLFGAVTVYTCIGDCVGNKLPEGGWTEEIVDVSPAVE